MLIKDIVVGVATAAATELLREAEAGRHALAIGFGQNSIHIEAEHYESDHAEDHHDKASHERVVIDCLSHVGEFEAETTAFKVAENLASLRHSDLGNDGQRDFGCLR